MTNFIKLKYEHYEQQQSNPSKEIENFTSFVRALIIRGILRDVWNKKRIKDFDELLLLISYFWWYVPKSVQAISGYTFSITLHYSRDWSWNYNRGRMIMIIRGIVSGGSWIFGGIGMVRGVADEEINWFSGGVLYL